MLTFESDYCASTADLEIEDGLMLRDKQVFMVPVSFQSEILNFLASPQKPISQMLTDIE